MDFFLLVLKKFKLVTSNNKNYVKYFHSFYNKNNNLLKHKALVICNSKKNQVSNSLSIRNN